MNVLSQMSFSPALSDSNLVSESDPSHLKSWLTDISGTEYFMILFENPHPPGYKVSVVNKTQKNIFGKNFSEPYFISDVCD